MTKEDKRLELNELCDRAGVTPRTVRYYIQRGLLPSPGSGAGARYHRAHLERLALIKALQSQHLPLHEIANRLDAMSDEDVSRAVAASRQPVAPSSAADYIRGILAREPVGRSIASGLPGVASSVSKVYSPPAETSPRRDHWERIRLSDDIELHVKRPLSREMNRRIERLLAAAHRILFDEP